MKAKNSFGVRFITRALKGNIQQTLVYVRITVNKKRHEISLKRTVDVLYWNKKEERI
jgi:integrase/recombinase XerD